MRERTFEILQPKIARVLSLISNHLDEDLTLERLASAAALFPYHFHRIWRATTGQPIGETVRRLRFERAGHALLDTQRSIIQIALEAGFASPQAFSRAFRQAIGMTPSDFRTEGRADRLRWSAGAVSHAPIEVEILTLEPFTVVATRRVGRYDETTLARTFGVVWDWACRAGLSEGLRGIYGVPLGDPGSVAPESLAYDACMDFGPDVRPPAPLQRLTLGGGAFARARVLGCYAGIEPASACLYGAWLPISGREADDRPMIIHYHNDPEQTPVEDLVTDLLLPLRSPS